MNKKIIHNHLDRGNLDFEKAGDHWEYFRILDFLVHFHGTNFLLKKFAIFFLCDLTNFFNYRHPSPNTFFVAAKKPC